jgi:hypothetical protein
MDRVTMECGSKARRVEKELTSIRMEPFLGDIFQMAKSRGQVQLIFQMEQGCRQFGKIT